MGPMAGLDGCGKSHPPTGIRCPDRPARSESLYKIFICKKCGCGTRSNLAGLKLDFSGIKWTDASRVSTF